MKKTILFLLVAVAMIMASCYTPHHGIRRTYHGHGDSHHRTGHH